MEFSRQEYWSVLPFPIPGDLPNPGIELISLVSPTVAGGFFTTEPHGKLKLDAHIISNIFSHHWPSCFYHTCFPPLEYIDWNGIIGSKCDYFKAFNTYWQIILQNTSINAINVYFQDYLKILACYLLSDIDLSIRASLEDNLKKQAQNVFLCPYRVYQQSSGNFFALRS